MSDDDLIRRGDALKALDWGDIYGRNAQQAIRALPATDAREKALREAAAAIRAESKVSPYRKGMTMVFERGLSDGFEAAAQVVGALIGEART